MKTFIIGLAVLYLSFIQVATADYVTRAIALQERDFEHIQFGKIKANTFTFSKGELEIKVDDSASFLMQSFESLQKIKRVRFKWRSSGQLLTRDSEHESQRSGDDAVLKLGLLVKSDDVLFNPFVPSWLKRVRENLKFPSKDMIYLVANAKHAAGEQWISPYNERVSMISIDSVADKQGWFLASYSFEKAVEVVAIWVMADGDDTHSRFSTRVTDIEIDVE